MMAVRTLLSVCIASIGFSDNFVEMCNRDALNLVQKPQYVFIGMPFARHQTHLQY
jgi:hypothetical protein